MCLLSFIDCCTACISMIRSCWRNFLAAVIFFFRVTCYFCSSFKGASVQQFERVRFVRRVISGLFGLSTFVLIYWIAVIRWADLVDMTSYVLYIFIGAYSCLVCCILNTFDLKKHIIQVTKTATLNVHVRPDPSDKTRKVVIVDEKSKAKRPPNRDRPPRSHDVTPIRPSTFSVNQETVKFLLPPSKDQVSHHANTDDGQTSKKVLKSALRKSKMYDESVHRCTTRL